MTDAEHAAALRHLIGSLQVVTHEEVAAIERAIWALEGGLTATYDQGLWDGMKARRVGSMSENDNG